MLKQIESTSDCDTATAAGWFKMTRDDSVHIMRVYANGFWTPKTVENYYEALRLQIASDRIAHRPVKILVDKRGAPVHPQETIEALQKSFTSFYHAGDRVAAVVDTNLTKMQFRRIYSQEITRPFLSMLAAEAWLLG